MDTSHATILVDLLRAVPADGARRTAALQRLTDVYAAAEAIAALQAAAAPLRGTTGPLADALSAASAAWEGSVNPSDPDVLYGPAHERVRRAIDSDAFLALIPGWIADLREIAVTRPGTGACTVASAMQLWLWTMKYFRKGPPDRETAIAELADAFLSLLAARCRILEIAGGLRTGALGTPEFITDLCHAHAARAAVAAGGVCAELVYGYRRHLAWDSAGCASCYGAEALDELEGLIPGIASAARGYTDVVESDGSHAAKAGPCARFDGVEPFTRLRARLDGCLTGARLAKDRAAAELPRVLSGIPVTVTR
jgi:hypothetical protein